MKTIRLLCVALFAVLVFTGIASAEEKAYMVQKGDCLSKIGQLFHIDWHRIAAANGLTAPFVIQPKQKLVIPEKPAITEKAPAGKKIAKKKHHGTLANPSVYDESKIGVDPYKGTLRHALELLGLIPKGSKVKLTSHYVATGKLESGILIHMVSGRNKAAYFRTKLKDETNVVVKEYSVTIDGSSLQIFRNMSCGNWFVKIPEAPPEAPPVAPPVETPPTPVQPPEVTPPALEAPPPVVPAPPMEQPTPGEGMKAPERKKEAIKRPCPDCIDLEVMAGAVVYVNSPGEETSTKGYDFWLEIRGWKNLAKDCSSEYWGGIGGIANYYHYKADHSPSRGDGWRAAGEAGIKRIYQTAPDENGLQYGRQWQLLGRLGFEKSHWENPETGKEIRQRGPVYGEYGEYIAELKHRKLYLVVQEELWLGFNQKITAPSEWHLKPQSRTYFSTFVGLDWRFAKNLTLRVGPGYNYQGWDKENVFAPQAQIMWDIPDAKGRLAFGVYGNFYSHIGPTLGLLARYENPYLLKNEYEKRRISEWHYAGTGIKNGEVANSTKQAEPKVNVFSKPIDKSSAPATLDYSTSVEDEIDKRAWPASNIDDQSTQVPFSTPSGDHIQSGRFPAKI